MRFAIGGGVRRSPKGTPAILLALLLVGAFYFVANDSRSTLVFNRSQLAATEESTSPKVGETKVDPKTVDESVNKGAGSTAETKATTCSKADREKAGAPGTPSRNQKEAECAKRCGTVTYTSLTNGKCTINRCTEANSCKEKGETYRMAVEAIKKNPSTFKPEVPDAPNEELKIDAGKVTDLGDSFTKNLDNAYDDPDNLTKLYDPTQRLAAIEGIEKLANAEIDTMGNLRDGTPAPPELIRSLFDDQSRLQPTTQQPIGPNEGAFPGNDQQGTSPSTFATPSSEAQPLAGERNLFQRMLDRLFGGPTQPAQPTNSPIQ